MADRRDAGRGARKNPAQRTPLSFRGNRSRVSPEVGTDDAQVGYRRLAGASPRARASIELVAQAGANHVGGQPAGRLTDGEGSGRRGVGGNGDEAVTRVAE